jgi:hypothetical protein
MLTACAHKKLGKYREYASMQDVCVRFLSYINLIRACDESHVHTGLDTGTKELHEGRIISLVL